MTAVFVCACGARWEDSASFRHARHLYGDAIHSGHDPMECSRQAGYESRFTGRQEMALAAVEHLIERRSLGAAEIAEIRTNLLNMVLALPLGKVKFPLANGRVMPTNSSGRVERSDR